MKKIIFVLFVILFGMTVFARVTIDTAVPNTVKIAASSLNVRCGPGTGYLRVAVVYRNETPKCLGQTANWYLIQLDNNIVGYISKVYVTSASSTPTATAKPAPVKTPAPTATSTKAPTTGLTADEQAMFNLVNQARKQNGVGALAINMELVKMARVKAQDMVTNNYFSHQSPTYGSPFDMMKSFGITYRAAGENLAANSAVDSAHTALMNSAGHRANILSTSYTQVGIGIVSSPVYGKMFVQEFIGK